MPISPEKYPGPLGKCWQDLLALLGIAVETTVSMLWPVVETIMGWLGKLVQIPRRLFKQSE